MTNAQAIKSYKKDLEVYRQNYTESHYLRYDS